MKKLLLLSCMALVPAMASTFNLVSDFQNSAFSYGYSTTLGGVFTAYGVTDTTSHPGATALLRSGTFTGNPPYVAKNTTGSPLNIGLSFLMPATMLDVHPGSAGEYTIVRFTANAATAGTYAVNGMFAGIDTATTDVHVLDNASSIFDSTINGQGNTTAFSLMVTLGIGDTLSFAVGNGGNGFGFDSTGIQGSLTTAVGTPEPASFALFALALIVGILKPIGRRSQA
jgi:hypothetical protein